jgi:hypothetical protein
VASRTCSDSAVSLLICSSVSLSARDTSHVARAGLYDRKEPDTHGSTNLTSLRPPFFRILG